jgi:hypothetical protein
MKRILTHFLLLTALVCSSATAFAQAQPAKSMTNPWWWGVNFGATWQTSDMQTKPGLGWGLTASTMSRYRENRPLWVGARFRYLHGVNYGYNYHRNYGLENNPVLNGTLDSTLNYNQGGNGYVFSNYKSKLDELAFELQIGSNSLRKQGILLYGWGGIGIAHVRTAINQRDAGGLMYNYSTIDSSGNRGIVHDQLYDMWDDTYETKADGNQSTAWKFMPSAGIGFGKTFGDRFGIALEHKVTFSLNDIIDGQQFDNAGLATGNNDIYHYSGVKLMFRFRDPKERELPPVVNNTQTNPNIYTNNPNNNNNNTNPNNNTTVITNPNNNNNNNNNQNQTGQPPLVTVLQPGTNPYTTNQPQTQVLVDVKNVTSQNQIMLTVNGMQNNNFTWNPSTRVMTINYMLQPGNNVFNITATNPWGSHMDSETIILQNQTNPNNQLPPQVTITNPAVTPFTSPSASMTINATVLNVSGASNITVRNNGSPITNFNYNSATHVVSFPLTLVTGTNLVEVIGTNNVGSASDNATILYNHSTPSGNPPVITIVTPAACPYTVTQSGYVINATITNVTSASQISVVFNGQPVTNFTWNQATSQLSFPVTLQPGNNTFSITASNGYGKDVASCQINYKVIPPTPPVVTITNPGTNPYTSAVPTQNFTATVLNVNSQNEITVKYNNQVVTNWAYDMNTKVLNFNNAALNTGSNVFAVTATNAAGTDSKNTTVIYRPVTNPVVPPVVTITSPNSNPYTSAVATQNFVATVLNVNSQNEITVKFNNQVVTNWSYNMTSKVLNFNNAALVTGSNVFTVTATNTAGTDSKNTTVIYKPVVNPVVVPPVVTITSPNTNPYTSGTPTQNFTATVLNVNSQNEITVTFNNQVVSGWSFNTNSKVLTYNNAALVNGQNVLTVTATNTAGTDSKNTTVIYKPVVNPVVPPVVTITLPNTNPYTSSTPTQNFKATVLNVNSQNEISVTYNNQPVSNWTYNMSTKVLMFQGTLNSGSNVLTVTATNTAGTDSKNTTVIFRPVTNPVPPVVTITTPSSNPYTATVATQNFTATVLNVNSQNEITVKYNNQVVTNWSYNMSSKVLTFNNATLISGSNVFEVAAANNNGSDSKNTTVIYRPVTNPQADPVITLKNPATGSMSTTTSSVVVTAQVANVSTAADIRVRLNGTPITTFTFANGLLTVNATVINGTNTLELRAINTTGYANKTVTITYAQPQKGTSGSTGSTGTTSPKSGGNKSTTTTTTTPSKTTTPSTPKGGASGSTGTTGSTGAKPKSGGNGGN